jgi:hypothetical protein
LLLLKKEGFDGMVVEASRGSFIYGEQLAARVKIYLRGLVTRKN